MTERSGDGPNPILFGAAPLPARTQTHRGYLARPDLRGTYPTILMLPPASGLTASMTWLCRHLARWGFAVVAPDLLRGAGPGKGASDADLAIHMAGVSDARATADITDVLRFVASPGTEWSSPEQVGILGIGTGGRFATLAAAMSPELDGLALVYAPFDDGDRSQSMLDALEGLEIPVLGIYGREDDVVDVEAVTEARTRQPRAEWVVYQDAGHDFLDDGSARYDAAAAVDARGRIVEFFEATLAGDRRSAA